MASSCIFFIISMPEENPKCGDVIGNPTKESHALGSKVENIDLNDKKQRRERALSSFPNVIALLLGSVCNLKELSPPPPPYETRPLRPAAMCLF